MIQNSHFGDVVVGLEMKRRVENEDSLITSIKLTEALFYTQ
jgi:hypothetical protein